MYKYILKRLVLLIPVIIGVSLLVFSIMDIAEGDPVYQIVSPHRKYRRSCVSCMRVPPVFLPVRVSYDRKSVKKP